MEILKVSSKSNPNLVAGALAAVLRESSHAELQAVGAGAVNQAVKAIAITRSFIADEGLDLICVPSFSDVNIDGVDKTAIRIAVSSSAAPTGDIGDSKATVPVDGNIGVRNTALCLLTPRVTV